MPWILILMFVLLIIIFTCFIILLTFCINGMYNDLYDIIDNYINGNRTRRRYIHRPTRIIPINKIEENKPYIKQNYVVIQSPLNHISIGVESKIQPL